MGGSAVVSFAHLYEEDFLNGACSEGGSGLKDSVSMWAAMCGHGPCDHAPDISASGVVDGGMFIGGEFREAVDLPSDGYSFRAMRASGNVTSNRSSSTDSIRTDNGYISPAIRWKFEQMDRPDGKASASKRSVAEPSVSVTFRGTQGAFSQRECDTLLSRSDLVTRTDGSLDLSRTNFSSSFVGERFDSEPWPPSVNWDRDPSCDSLSPASNRTLPRHFGATRRQPEASPAPYPLATPVHVSDEATVSTMDGEEGAENTGHGNRSTWPGDSDVRRDVQNTWSP